MGEEIFIKESKKVAKTPKPKRKLTQAQLDGLAKGRARMAEKRAALKKDGKIATERLEKNKEDRRLKRQHINENREREIKAKFEKKKMEKIQVFSELKYQALEKCKTEKEYNELNSIFDEIDDNMITDTTNLHKMLMEKANKYRIPKKVENSHRDKLREMESLQKPNVEIIVEEDEEELEEYD